MEFQPLGTDKDPRIRTTDLQIQTLLVADKIPTIWFFPKFFLLNTY
jgi:hypothetical protein